MSPDAGQVQSAQTSAKKNIHLTMGPLARRRAKAGYVFVMPAVIVLLVINIVPIAATLYLSFTDYDLLRSPSWVGLKNYRDLLTSDDFIGAIGRSLYFTVAQVPAGTILALLIALLLNQRLLGTTPTRAIAYLPQAASYTVIALIWSFLYNPATGPLNVGLRAIGYGTTYFLTDTELAMPSIVVMSIWRNLGYYMLIYLAALQSIPQDLYEAASLDGASTVNKFFNITVPLLAQVTAFIVITWTLGAMQMFTQAYVMTGGGPVDATTTIVFMVYQEAFLFLRMGRASAMAFVLFVIVMILALLGRRFLLRPGNLS